MKARRIASPAFMYDRRQGFRQSPDAERVVNRINRLGERPFRLEPANSVMAQDGEPIWGTGGGFVQHDSEARRIGSTGYVDPLEGTTWAVAHEGAHASMPTRLERDTIEGRIDPWPVDPREVPRDSGARMRFVHEGLAKRNLVEEAHAQGVAQGISESLGLPGEEGWNDPLEYPATFRDRGLEVYGKNEVGPPSPGEIGEWRRIERNTPDLLKREFERGRRRGRGS